jgi:flagellar hook protein FlgE
MIRSLYSGVSGMLNHQLRMDLIGNNISNINTIGFKSSQANFQESFSQISRGATDSSPVGLYVGLGSQALTTQTAFSQGAFQRTDVASDLAIGGDGFFAVVDNGGQNFVTRAGDFIVDKDGYMRTPSGQFLLGFQGTTAPASPTAGFPGWQVQIPTVIGATTERVVNYSVGVDGKIVTVGELGNTETLGFVPIMRYGNANGLKREGSNLYSVTPAAGTNEFFLAGVGGAGSVQSGALELSNVDLAKEFSDMIVTQRGFDANARIITTADEMLQTVTNLKR